mmetsp:Transcript_14149/g.33425  ORF Transcript_14149/g.33425 Transcript_14149/m.33425 type:complete len:278 (-) Transcript_14149:1373-2206(-)
MHHRFEIGKRRRDAPEVPRALGRRRPQPRPRCLREEREQACRPEQLQGHPPHGLEPPCKVELMQLKEGHLREDDVSPGRRAALRASGRGERLCGLVRPLAEELPRLILEADRLQHPRAAPAGEGHAGPRDGSARAGPGVLSPAGGERDRLDGVGRRLVKDPHAVLEDTEDVEAALRKCQGLGREGQRAPDRRPGAIHDEADLLHHQDCGLGRREGGQHGRLRWGLLTRAGIEEVRDGAVPEGDHEVPVVGGRDHRAAGPRHPPEAVALVQVEGLDKH